MNEPRTVADISELDTLVHRAERKYEDERERLAGQAGIAGSNYLAEILADLAEAEGYLEPLAVAQSMVGRIHADAITDELVKRALYGPQDNYSGRTNDVKRARFDGFLRGVEAAREHLS